MIVNIILLYVNFCWYTMFFFLSFVFAKYVVFLMIFLLGHAFGLFLCLVLFVYFLVLDFRKSEKFEINFDKMFII